MFRILPRKRWKILLMTGAVIISAFFLWFTNYLVSELSKREIAEVQKVADAFQELNNSSRTDFTSVLNVIRNATIPIIEVDENGDIMHVKNIDTSKLKDSAWLKGQVKVMHFYNDPVPIRVAERFHYVYYKEQRAITLLRYFPYVQLLLIFLFLGISYTAFDASRRYEQNRVWVGLAKETAHQIGTPLSSLIAWVEYMRSTEEPPGEEVLQEIEKDLSRLGIITERFSKIGSTPELHPANVYDVVAESLDYLSRRISQKVKLYITPDSNPNVRADLNKNLFSWVIENLTKNAVDAMAGAGEVAFRIWQTHNHVYITVKDTGKGIHRGDFKRVFEPGFTTKKRGWGLGLSLSKRIVENYHSGEIIVKDSEIGKGTTFRIRLKRIPK